MGIVGIIDSATSIIKNVLIPLAFALCLLYFFWGVVIYIRKGVGSEEAAKEGKRVMVFGIIGLFVAVAVWGIVSFIQSELGILPIENIERPGSEYTTENIIYQ